MADNTETAGVITPSPKNRHAPMIPTRASAALPRPSVATRIAKAMRAKMPPSPLLSALMTSTTYLMVTIIMSDQKISDRMPSISNSATPWLVKWSRLALKA